MFCGTDIGTQSNVYFKISRKRLICIVYSIIVYSIQYDLAEVSLQTAYLFHLQTLMNACPVTGFALNSASILKARIHAAAIMDSSWIQMAELAQVIFICSFSG